MSNSTSNKRLTWLRWEVQDPIEKRHWTAFTVSIYAPTEERRYVSVLTSIANGGGKVLFRTSSVAEAHKVILIPEEGKERLEMAEIKARVILKRVLHDQRIIDHANSLAPGAKLVRTDTGEVVATG